MLRLGNRIDDLQQPHGVSGDNAGRDGGGNPLLPARSRDDHALCVLEDISADGHTHALRQTAERIPHHRRRISDGDGFGAARRGNQFALQYTIIDFRLFQRQHTATVSFGAKFS
ncbi:hypothetical protein SDC9_83556 [bioreactor metagenome]|uniref:Uncharacterized protein n=1 Tax=bioreactor metagenome TaxID=1076179 RepID=A0A644Z835_9ZZZZ